MGFFNFTTIFNVSLKYNTPEGKKPFFRCRQLVSGYGGRITITKIDASMKGEPYMGGTSSP